MSGWSPSGDVLVTRLEADTLDETLMDYKYYSGFFYEKEIADLSEILPVCGSRCQTLSYYGLTERQLAEFLRAAPPRASTAPSPSARRWISP